MTSVRMRQALFIGAVLLCLLAAAVNRPTQAIIIRHDRDYGEHEVNENRFPAVFYLEQRGQRKVCVATVIDPGWAITAAHCGQETSLLATLDQDRKFTVTVAGAEREIDLVVNHPDFLPGAENEVDLALLRFAEPLQFPRPIPLQAAPEEQGKTVTLVGWGYFGLGTTGRQYDDGRFRLAENRIEDAGRRLIIRFDDPRDTQAEVTRLEGMPGLGDSGGPALLPSAGFWTVAGIAVGEIMDVGFSEETQGRYGALAVYERISEHLDWIERTMQEHGSGAAAEPAVHDARNH